MITEKLVDEMCITRGLKKLSISKFPSWINKNHQEGIELNSGNLISFWVKDGERIYNEPPSESINKTFSEIMKIPTDTEKKPYVQKPEIKPMKAVLTDGDKSESNGILPDILTPALMSKWASMTTTDRILLFQKTPDDKIDHVIIGKKNGKDITAPYVKGNYMFREANAAFLFDWYLDNVNITVGFKGVSVTGRLYAYFTEYNKYLSRPATGYQELNSQVDAELAKKGATTDAIKKGLSLFGFNSDVYSGERE